METNKFEEHIQEKLKGREINPSETAWERISGQLETPQKQPSKNYLWYAIAASFIGLLFISIFFLDEIESPYENEIVNAPKSDKDSNLKEETFETKDGDAIKVVLEKFEPNTPKNTDFDSAIFKKQELVSVKEKKTKPDPKAVKGSIITNKNFDKPMVSDAIVEAKIAELLEKVDALEQNNSALADAEVDSLLKIAQQEILDDKIFASSKALDASALLAEVEDELDQSFRIQIFEKLKTGLLKVRTAVADRNN